MTLTSSPHHVLLVRCADRKGVVAAVSGFLSAHDASIVESHQFNDAATNDFFMRAAFRADGSEMPDVETLREAFAKVATPFGMEWQLFDGSERPRVVIAVSRFGHCLQDLLHRWQAGSFAVDIVAVVSNHEDFRSFVEWCGVPFHYLPISKETKREQEAKFMDIIAAQKTDLVVLARYMQVLSKEMSQALYGRCINIHHSFLPGFKGARPYHQAFDRGVKIIGATAHYVTDDLDEGPIIEQAVERVSHTHPPAEMVQIGRDIECRVLARAVAWHIDRRVMLNGQRTVVFA